MINWPEHLADALARRRAIVQIGSGVSANARSEDGKRPPTWREFLALAVKKCGEPKHIKSSFKGGDLLKTCEFVKNRLGTDWYALLRAEFGDPPYKPAKIHEAIFNLDARIVLSTNFDRIYDNYAISTSEHTVVIKDHTADDVGLIVYGNDRYIIKLHGSIDSPTKMIFTESDYAQARTRCWAFYSFVDALISTNICLMIGSGLNDPDIKMLFEDYKHRSLLVPHYIVLPRPVHDDEVTLVKNTRGLNVIQYSGKNDHEELTQSLIELGTSVESRRAEMANNQSW